MNKQQQENPNATNGIVDATNTTTDNAKKKKKKNTY